MAENIRSLFTLQNRQNIKRLKFIHTTHLPVECSADTTKLVSYNTIKTYSHIVSAQKLLTF